MEGSVVDKTWSDSNEVLFDKCFPLHRACRDGDVQHLSSLLSSGQFDLYQEDDFYGWTPIHWAAYFGKFSCLMMLNDHDACLDATTERLNQSPAHIVAYGGHATCLKWLLQHGSLINRQLACLRQLINTVDGSGVNRCDLVSSRFSQTPSHLSAYAGHPQCLYWLIHSKCNVNAQDYMGETPIHKAARTGSMECISLLVSQGAKLSIKNYSGNDASQVARQADHIECANYLERALQLQTKDAEHSRGSPDGQPASQNCFISNNIYHSHPHIISSVNASARFPVLQNGQRYNSIIQSEHSLDNNNQSEDCDMEMDVGIANSNMAASGDVLLDQGVTSNIVPVAGRKRGREESEESCLKRARNDDYVYTNGNNGVVHQNNAAEDPLLSSHSKLSGCLQNNAHMSHELISQDAFSSHMNHPSHELANQESLSSHMTHVSESMVEHSTTVSVQQGYDSLMMDSLISEYHGS